jgi:ribosomal protein L37AE/L43A
MSRERCPNCLKQMSRTLDGSGKWICLPCGRTWAADDPKLKNPWGDLGNFADLFGGGSRRRP